MSKKFSIVKEIDLDKLRKQIELYRYETGESTPYLFIISVATAIELLPEIGLISAKGNISVGKFIKFKNGVNLKM